ncbi:MAG: malate synthase A [Chloroflexi bacterium]|nr:malate synthase A [Chloroflexota bacterium]MCY3696796.1 malate synthase A [Chloroflexota bacterium]
MTQTTELSTPAGVEIVGAISDGFETILSEAALAFVAGLHRQFNARRQELLQRRMERQVEFDNGALPDFLSDTEEIRFSSWQVAPTPEDLQQRWAEITGPVDRKMMIGALNSGADAFMADFEDALSPTWDNIVNGQINARDAVRREISFENPDGSVRTLNEQIATLLIRPRGWHLDEKHVLVDGQPICASLFDFGMYMFHNAAERIARGTGPYFYLPKLESHLEARLWNDAFVKAQDDLGVPQGSIRATVLIETLPAAFEMEEILYELRDHSAGLNAGRWDYIFSAVKRFKSQPTFTLPDRVQVTMTTPFMRAYTELLVRTCHKRGAHAMGGMAAFIPSRRDPEINEVALTGVRADKERESTDGFDGTWVAHPDLVSVARDIFETNLGGARNQRERMREDVDVSAGELVSLDQSGGSVSEAGLRANISVALQYINSWLNGVGAAGINNLMEDAATAEISRGQIWQWIRHGAELDDGRSVTSDLYESLRDDELAALGGRGESRYGDAVEILDQLVLNDEFTEFLTLPAYEYLD